MSAQKIQAASLSAYSHCRYRGSNQVRTVEKPVQLDGGVLGALRSQPLAVEQRALSPPTRVSHQYHTSGTNACIWLDCIARVSIAVDNATPCVEAFIVAKSPCHSWFARRVVHDYRCNHTRATLERRASCGDMLANFGRALTQPLRTVSGIDLLPL